MRNDKRLERLNKVTYLLKQKEKKDTGGFLKEYQQPLIQGTALLGSLTGGLTEETNVAGQGLSGALSGASAGASIGSIVPGIGTGIGAGVGAIVGAIGGGRKAKEAKKQEMKHRQELQRLSTMRAIQNAGNTFEDGGILTLKKKLKVLDGGSLSPISQDAVEVQADQPFLTDSVELDNAFVDNNEIIDNQDRVFSDSLTTMSGRTIAKEAKRLEKMKSDNMRFSDSNDFIDRKLDDLFNYQENIKRAKAKIAIAQKQKSDEDEYLDLLGPGGSKREQILDQRAKQKMTRLKQNKELSNLLESKDSLAGGGYSATEIKKPKFAKGGGLSRKEDYGSKKKPYPSVESKDFAGGERSYPIPTKADAVDALRLAGLHGRSDVKSKVYAKYPSLKKNKQIGGGLDDLPELTGTTFLSSLGIYPESAKLGRVRGVGQKPFKQPKFAEVPALTGQDFLNDLSISTEPTNIPTTPTQKPAGGSTSFDLQPALTSLATFGPNLVSGVLQSRLKGPTRPAMETLTSLKRVRPDAQLANITNQARTAQALLTKGTAQSSDLMAGIGNLLSRRIQAENEAIGQTQNLNAQIQSQEAQINQAVKARNAARINQFQDELTSFSNKKKQLTAENIANLSQKVLQLGREKNMMKRDAAALELIKEGYGDSGVLNRLEQANPELAARLKSLLGEKPSQKTGGKLYKRKKTIYPY